MNNKTAKPNFNEDMLIICDNENGWVLHFIKKTLQETNFSFIRVDSSTSMRTGWERFKNVQRIIIHWENEKRSGGAIVEEILDINQNYNITDKIIILTSNPTREDVIYLNELDLKRIIRLRHREKELSIAAEELKYHMSNPFSKNKIDVIWKKLQQAIYKLSDSNASKEEILKIEKMLLKIHNENKETARYCDIKASIEYKKQNYMNAEKFWLRALEINPNYLRAYNNLINLYRNTDRLITAYNLMQKLHTLNNANISRMVAMGEVQLEINDYNKAEHYFNLALEKDKYCGGALNGLAKIKFTQGDFDEAKSLISKSTIAYKFAVELNKKGIQMVKEKQYEDALKLYSNAQYVVPQQFKGPMLFYNIGLCYFKWGKKEFAEKFLKIALIKEPNYKKAQVLLESI